MRNIISLTLVLFLAGCSKGPEKIELSDINFYLEADQKIDSVLFANWTQDREYHILPYSDTLQIELVDTTNDYYFINFFIGDKKVHHQFWLDGEDIIIEGKVSNRLDIDTVIGSKLYYKSLDFRRELGELSDQMENQKVINDFLLKEFDKNQDDVFSIEIGNRYYGHNRSDEEELRKLYYLQLTQADEIKTRLDNSINQIERTLTIEKIDFSNFQFYDIDGELRSVNLEEGKRYLIDYWFIACAPCIEQHKSMMSRLEFLKSKEIEVIGISIDQDQEAWSKFLLEENYRWPNYRENYMDHRLRDHLMISVFPTYFYLDSDGTILKRIASFEEFEEYLGNMTL